jgi:peptidoglycan/xylan/chitin deacetylase (PgdA/CDA1 family)
MRNNRVQRIKKLMMALPILLSVAAAVMSVVTLISVNDINRRLRSVSLNSYVEQTLVSYNYVIGSSGTTRGDSGADISGNGVSATLPPDIVRTRVYLTFDDGPSHNTEKILDILKKHNVRATFFVNGKASESTELEPLYRDIAEDGHAIGMHSYSHKYSEIYSSREAFETDLDKIHSLIYNETGIDTRLYRFPGGSANTVSRQPMSQFADVLHQHGYEYYDWNIYPGDNSGRAYPKEAIISGILGNISEYRVAIILLHDSDTHGSTVEALPEVVEGLLTQGAEFCVMDSDTPAIQQISY